MKHKHHIIPKSLGGSDDESNLVKLTIPGHAAVHKFMYEEYGRYQDKFAWQGLTGLIGKEEIVRLNAQLSAKKRFRNKENHPMYNKNHTIESKQKIKETRKKRNLCTPVAMYDRKGILLMKFDTMFDASKYIGVRYSTIPESIQRNYYVRKKYKFKRLNDN